ncbi:MAG: Daunorubicin/doxorubicin resistance ATP-binding protein DrrA [Firmicutes bacterium ADurb.Bin467]|nr:MAG: Daunorubicin/doxorubicin resistance ATP-binding protein DrrA [Firmicutes bacterium ADurb.Bin467]
MEKILEVEGLKKAYGPVRAVDGIDFYLDRGKLFAFLGPNGAGKSTTIDILCTILKPDAGEVALDGHRLGKDDAAIRASIGVVFQDHLLDPLLTVEENMRARGGFYKKTRAELAEAVRWAAREADAGDFLKRPYGKLSGGQRRRADIARALINTPKLLFLDEPTTGLDPQTRKGVWDSVQTLKRETGLTVFLTTHYMEEAAEADYVVVIDGGHIVAKGTPNQLRAEYASDRLKLFPSDAEGLARALGEMNARFERVSDQVVVKLGSTMEALPLLEAAKPFIFGFEVLGGTMDDAFIGITGREIRP